MEVWYGREEILLSEYSLTFRVCTRIGGSCCYQPSDEQSVWSIAGHQPGHSGDMVPRPFRLSATQIIWYPGHSGYLVPRPFRLSGAQTIQVIWCPGHSDVV